MANTYASSTFVIDTSTNIAGLIALKGSAITTTDHICIKANSNGIAATLTIEQSINCASLNIGYGAVNGGSTSYGICIVNDGVVITLAASGKVYLRAGSIWTCNGTLHLIGIGNGSADQTFTSRHSNNQDIQVNGEWWTLVPDLTGKRVVCGTTINSTTINVASDPRNMGIANGSVVDIIKVSDGTMIASGRTVSSIGASSFVISGSAITTDSSHAVYIPYASTDKIYSMNGTTITFGDGNISTWNNNGGAKVPNNATIVQPGITLTCTDLTEANKARFESIVGIINWHGVAMQGMKESTLSAGSHLVGTTIAPIFNNCSFRSVSSYGLSFGNNCNNVTLNNCIATSTTSYGIFFANGTNNIALTDFVGISTASYGIYLSYGCVGSTLINCTGKSISGFGITGNNGCVETVLMNCMATSVSSDAIRFTCNTNITLTNCTGISISAYGIYLAYGTNNSILTSCKGVSSTGYGIIVGYGSDNITLINCTGISTTNNGIYSLSGCGALKIIGCRGSGTNSLVARQTFSGGSIIAHRNAATGELGRVTWQASDMDIGDYNTGTSIGLITQNKWIVIPECWIPGLSSYGTTTIATTLNGGTITSQYRVSHDYGKTYTDWANIPTTITDIPDSEGEYIQFRIAKTDAGINIPIHQGINIACTFVDGWTIEMPYSALGMPCTTTLWNGVE